MFAYAWLQYLNKIIDNYIGIEILAALVDQIGQSFNLQLDLFVDAGGQESAFDDFGGVELIIETVVVEALELVIGHIKASLLKEIA